MSAVYFVARDKCPACAATTIHEIYRRSYQHPPLRSFLEKAYIEVGKIEYAYLEGAEFILTQCDLCQLVFQAEVPNDELMSKIYEEWIDPALTFQHHVADQTLDYYNRVGSEVAALIAMFHQKPHTLKFLDFGMGWGEWVRLARAFGVQAMGVELSQARIQFAQSQGIPVIAWEEIGAHQFDLIYADQVFEHLAHPLETLQSLTQALKSTGLIKIGVPDGRDIQQRLQVEDWSAPKGTRNSLNATAPLEHINCFNRHALLKMGSQAGLVPLPLPLALQYTHLLLGDSLKEIIKSLGRPIVRDVLQQGNYVLFKRA